MGHCPCTMLALHFCYTSNRLQQLRFPFLILPLARLLLTLQMDPEASCLHCSQRPCWLLMQRQNGPWGPLHQQFWLAGTSALLSPLCQHSQPVPITPKLCILPPLGRSACPQPQSSDLTELREMLSFHAHTLHLWQYARATGCFSNFPDLYILCQSVQEGTDSPASAPCTQRL